MAKFYYKVLNKDSRIEEGTISALFKSFAEKQLKKQGSTPIIVIPEKTTLFGKSISFFSGFTPAEKINFF
jgi:type II secretory pathway component PulF